MSDLASIYLNMWIYYYFDVNAICIVKIYFIHESSHILAAYKSEPRALFKGTLFVQIKPYLNIK